MPTTTTLKRSLAGVDVYPIGLGDMPMSLAGRPDEDRSIRTIHAALDAGVTLIDTADAYHRDAARWGTTSPCRQGPVIVVGATDVLVATKGGHLRPGDGSLDRDGRPDHLKEAAEASLRRLGGDAIGLYQFHRPDPDVPYAESVGALLDLLDEGKVRGWRHLQRHRDPARRGSAASRPTSSRSRISSRSPTRRRSPRASCRPARERGIAFLPWSPLGGIGSLGLGGGRRPGRGRGRGARRVATAGRAGVAALARSRR